jgi:5-methylthioadenosine/S-adenosylhomocysteine deaminase
MSILIRNALLKDNITDILIKGNRIVKIANGIGDPVSTVIDGTGKLAMPGLMNSHTHAAMTLMRGYSDDLPVKEWLENKIWPLEANLTEEDVYWGAKLACLEMIRTGTTFFNDMYWHFHSTARAVDEMGLRATISPVFLDLFDRNVPGSNDLKTNNGSPNKSVLDRIRFILGPHAIYSVSRNP